MKVLIYTHLFPYPATEGGKVAQFLFLQFLCQYHHVSLVTPHFPEFADNIQRLTAQLPSLSVYSLKDQGKTRRKGFIDVVLLWIEKLHWRIKKLQAENSEEYNNKLKPLYTFSPKSPNICDQFLSIIEREKPDIVQIDFIDNADLVTVIPEYISTVLVMHELRFATLQKTLKLLPFSGNYNRYLADLVKTLEAAIVNKFTAVITFSNQDKDRIAALVSKPKVTSIPYAINVKESHDIEFHSYPINKLTFIGPSHHNPNYDAVRYYIDEIANDVYQNSGLKLEIIGSWPEKIVRKLGNEKVVFTGFAENLFSALNHSIMVVPVRIGSGVRTKILDAFSMGIPVITTTIGCEGIGVEDGKECLIADNSSMFFHAINKLLVNPNLTQQLRKNAYKFVQDNFSIEKIGRQRIAFYQSLVGEKSFVK